MRLLQHSKTANVVLQGMTETLVDAGWLAHPLNVTTTQYVPESAAVAVGKTNVGFVVLTYLYLAC